MADVIICNQVVEKDSAILGWPNELDIASSSHHSGICKFPSSSNERYRTAIANIKDLVDVATDYDSPRKFLCMPSANLLYMIDTKMSLLSVSP
jgi:hypothetical protein